jgi:hypothetical protein
MSTTRLLLLSSALAIATSAGATMMVKRLSLDQVAAEAQRIVHGRVVEVRSGRDEHGAPATWVTLDVERTLKGSAGGRLTVKQLGAADPLPDGGLAVIAGLPRYAVGEEVVLFLRGDSARGFTSPVGFGQGVYRVDRTDGRALVRRDLPGASEPLDAFLSTVGRAATWNAGDPR